MPDMKDKLREMERELKASGSLPRERGSLEKLAEAQKEKKRHAMKRQTKRKILVGSALALALLLVWKKVQINFVVFTSFWGFLGIIGAVFLMIYLVLNFFFADKDDQ